MELKVVFDSESEILDDYFNRTIMELKVQRCYTFKNGQVHFNRTIMELKEPRTSAFCLTQ